MFSQPKERSGSAVSDQRERIQTIFTEEDLRRAEPIQPPQSLLEKKRHIRSNATDITAGCCNREGRGGSALKCNREVSLFGQQLGLVLARLRSVSGQVDSTQEQSSKESPANNLVSNGC